jgi:hypothetical protein
MRMHESNSCRRPGAIVPSKSHPKYSNTQRNANDGLLCFPNKLQVLIVTKIYSLEDDIFYRLIIS